MNGCFGAILQKYRIKRTTMEPNTPKLNSDERYMCEVNKLGNRLMLRMIAPLCLWDYAHDHAASIMSLTCNPNILVG